MRLLLETVKQPDTDSDVAGYRTAPSIVKSSSAATVLQTGIKVFRCLQQTGFRVRYQRWAPWWRSPMLSQVLL